jgi:hypothetical protein
MRRITRLRIFEIKVRNIPVLVPAVDAGAVGTLVPQFGIRRVDLSDIKQVSRKGRKIWALNDLRVWDQDRKRAEQNLARHVRTGGGQVSFYEQVLRDYDRELRS